MNALPSLLLALIVGLVIAGNASAQPADTPDPNTSEVWLKVHASFLGGRKVNPAGPETLELEAPVRAEDAATVPIAIRTRLTQTPDRYIRRVYLVIDNNPSPVGAVFEMTPESGRADLETRVRIEQYSFVRAIAELNDGTLHGVARYVKASGGCSAPAGKDLQEALARLGKTRFRVEGDVEYSKPVLAQLMISHPNISGLAKDQVTHLYEPAYFVRRIAVTYAGKTILTADVDFTISENPNFRFYFTPNGPGELKAEVVDTKDLKFESTVAVRAGTQTAGRVN